MKQQWHSGFDDSSGWGRLIDPVCLFILCQIAGTLWVIAPMKPFTPPVAPSAAADIQRAEGAGLKVQREALEKAVKLAREQAATLAKPAESTVEDKDRLAAELGVAEQLVKNLKSQLYDLQEKVAQAGAKLPNIPPPNPKFAADADELNRQLKEKQAELARLKTELDQTNGLGGGSGVGSPRMVTTSLLPKFVQVIGNRAIPLDDQHYHIHCGTLEGTNEKACEYTKNSPGETAEQIQRPGSDVMSYLKGIDPKQKFLMCAVASDSFAAFRSLRQTAQKMNIRVAWSPDSRANGTILLTEGKGEGPTVPE
jgi:hypothetical protein